MSFLGVCLSCLLVFFRFYAQRYDFAFWGVLI